MRHPGGGRTVVVSPENYNESTPQEKELAQLSTTIPKPDAAASKADARALKSGPAGPNEALERPSKSTSAKDKPGVSRTTLVKTEPGLRQEAMGKPGKPGPSGPMSKKDSSVRARHPVEFDHAIYYVTTVKRRFSDQPETYKSFLEILHTYQKEQRSIKEVLDRVSELFSEHPDLLKEFTYFLPDAVQEQAKERLQRAAREAELRQARQGGKHRRRPAGPARRGAGGGSHGDRPHRDRLGLGTHEAPADAAHLDGKFADAGFATDAAGDDPFDASQRKMHVARVRRQRSEAVRKQASVVFSKESSLLARIKKVLMASNRGPALWHDFLKCLNLFSRQVFDRQDMLRLSDDILGGEPEMLNEFRALLGPVTAAKSEAELNPYASLPLGEINFSNCAVATPSYRALPENYPRQLSSARMKLEDSVLNDEWVSLPVGSEENYSFKHMRKNQYEEALFKCEDDLFEVDMILGATKNTISVLEQLVLSLREAEEKAAQAAKKMFLGSPADAEGEAAADERVMKAVLAARRSWRPDGEMLRSFHIAAVSRVYGDQASEVLNALKLRPSSALPVILSRLRQKNAEWLASQNTAKSTWKEMMEQNFAKSLDHRSFYFRQTEKRVLSVRHIVGEVKERKEAIEVALATLASKEDEPGQGNPEEGLEVVLVSEETPADQDNGDQKQGGEAKEADADAALSKEDTAMRAMRAAAPLLFSTTSMEGPKYRDLCLCDRESGPAHFSPHQVFRHEETAVQKDAFLILQHAVDCSSHSVGDRAKMHYIWRHALSLFYHMPMDLVYHGRAISKGLLDGNRNSSPPKRYHLDESLNMLVFVNTSKLEYSVEYGSYIHPTGSDVLTSYGAARVLGTRASKDVGQTFFYEVELSYGKATLAPSAVLRSLTPDPLHFAAEAADDAYDDAMSAAEAMVGAGGKTDSSSDEEGKKADLSSITGLESEIFLGTQSALAFFSLFALLCDRLSTARRLAKVQEEEAPQAPVAHPLKIKALDLQADFTISNTEDTAGETPRAARAGRSTGIVATLSTENLSLQVPDGPGTAAAATPREAQTPQREPKDSWEASFSPVELETPRGSMLGSSYGYRASRSSCPWNKYHAYWLELVKMLDNELDPTEYEDNVRKLLGNRSYPLYTMDKLCNVIVKQLHTLATDEASSALCDLYVTETLRARVSGKLDVDAYKRRAGAVLASLKTRPEDLYCFKYSPGLCFRKELWRSEDDASCFTFIPEHRRRPDEIDAGLPAMDKLRDPLTGASEGSSTALLLVEFLGVIAHARSNPPSESADNMTTLALAAGAEDDDDEDDQQISSGAEDNMTVASEAASADERPRTRRAVSPSPSNTPTASDADHAFMTEEDEDLDEAMDAEVDTGKEDVEGEDEVDVDDEDDEEEEVDAAVGGRPRGNGDFVEDVRDAAAPASADDANGDHDLQKTVTLEQVVQDEDDSALASSSTAKGAAESGGGRTSVGTKRPARGRGGWRKRRRY
eukprot:scaffold1954_cov268-Pinguiococcus_pyrenoidosus.AAC.319